MGGPNLAALNPACPWSCPISSNAYLFVLQLLSAAMLAGAVQTPVLAQNGTAPRGTQRPLELLDSSREEDGLRGPVRRVRSEVARLRVRGTTIIEGPRRLLELTVYDAGGRRAANKTYPVLTGPAGEESNVYDERGNLAETIKRDGGGSVISRTVYSYEFDSYGNWTKAVASLAVGGSDGHTHKPADVTYRVINYYSSPASVGDPASAPASEQSRHSTVPAQRDPGIPDVGEINGKALTLPPPAYPLGQRPKGGPVEVEVVVEVDESGRVVSAKAARAPRLLREAAEGAARGAIFLPFRAGGVPSRVRGTLRYT